jgi:hypothetical protein
MQQRGDRTTQLTLLAVCASLVVMVAVTAALGLADLVRVSGPAVGDIVAFDAKLGVSDDLPNHLSVTRTDGTACQLDLQVMQRVHGSLIVDATSRDPQPAYRLHWSGTHSSLDANDCGPTADVMASDRVMAALLVATGGVGIGPHKQALPVYLVRHPPRSGL